MILFLLLFFQQHVGCSNYDTKTFVVVGPALAVLGYNVSYVSLDLLQLDDFSTKRDKNTFEHYEGYKKGKNIFKKGDIISEFAKHKQYEEICNMAKEKQAEFKENFIDQKNIIMSNIIMNSDNFVGTNKTNYDDKKKFLQECFENLYIKKNQNDNNFLFYNNVQINRFLKICGEKKQKIFWKMIHLYLLKTINNLTKFQSIDFNEDIKTFKKNKKNHQMNITKTGINSLNYLKKVINETLRPYNYNEKRYCTYGDFRQTKQIERYTDDLFFWFEFNNKDEKQNNDIVQLDDYKIKYEIEEI